MESDRPLLDAFRRGEREALTRVYRFYVDDVARTVRAGVRVKVDGVLVRLGGRDLMEFDVEQLVQETFLRAFSENARRSYDGIRRYGPYLATIARNALIDRARHEKSGRNIAVDDLTTELASTDPGPAGTAEERELKSIVNEVKDGLREPLRSIFRLRYEEGKTQLEVAAQLNVAAITVRRADARLRSLLLKRLRDAGYLEHTPIGIPSPVRDRSRG